MWSTLTEMLAFQAQVNPDRPCARFVEHGEVVALHTYSQAWQWVTGWATLLRDRGVQRGEAVILALPNSEDFLGAYFGTLLAGGVPAPVAPIRQLMAHDLYLGVVASRLQFIEAKVLVVPEAQANVDQVPPLSELKHLTIVTRRDVPREASSVSPDGRGDDLALYQFTSGTAGSAKAVELTHSALLVQIRAISAALALDSSRDCAVSWLPLFHDMGLIGYMLTSIGITACVTLLPTDDFVVRPSLWIKALSDFRATITGGPPSAFALCARRMKASEVTRYDLSQVRIALVGAEMVSSESLSQFASKFEPAGFRATSLMPTYGMAENGLAVAMPPLDRGPEFDLLDLDILQNENRAVSPRSPDLACRAVASVGVPIPGMEIAIVNEAGLRLDERHIGEIIVRSPSLMRGYHGQPEVTAQALRDGWLYTGDKGYLAGGKLYVTGRQKEVMIVGGRNYYPDDLEQVAGAVPGVRKRAVAVSYADLERSTEAIVVLAETGLTERAERDALRKEIRQALVQLGFPVNEVVLLRPRTIETTLNGKLKRVEIKTRYLAGEFASDD